MSSLLHDRLGQLGMVGWLDRPLATNVSANVSYSHRAAPPQSLAAAIYPHLAKAEADRLAAKPKESK